MARADGPRGVEGIVARANGLRGVEGIVARTLPGDPIWPICPWMCAIYTHGKGVEEFTLKTFEHHTEASKSGI